MICASANPPGFTEGVYQAADSHQTKARLRIDNWSDLPDAASDAGLRADGRHLGGHSDVNVSEVLLGKLRLHFHRTALRKAEKSAAARTYDLTDLDVASEDQAGSRRDYIQLADLSARCAKLGLRNLDLGISGVTRGLLEVDLRLRDEATALKRNCAVVIRLGKSGLRLRGFDEGRLLGRLLRLDRAIDNRQDLAGLNPSAGVDEHANDAAALTSDSNRLIALRCEWAACGDHSAHRRASGNDDGDRRNLSRRAGARCCSAIGARGAVPF